MKIEINFLNNEQRETYRESYVSDKAPSATWHSRWKKYESDWMDEDIKNSTKSHFIDRVIINDAQITSKSGCEDMIEFLQNTKESFKY